MRLYLAAMLVLVFAAPASAQKIAVTFDDLPSHSALPPGVTRIDVAAAIIAALKAAKAPPVYGFVNGLRLEDDPPSAPVLQMWRDAGFPLANHTWSHMNLGQNSLADWQADTLKNETVLAPLMGKANWHWLRFPFLAEGDTLQKHVAARAFLASHHYRIAAVTMSFDDYLWNEPYARCMASGGAATVAQMETAWLAAAANALDYEHNLSLQLYGRDISYVLLMHIGAFDARMLPRLLELYRSKGVQLVSLEDTERDPFYWSDTNLRLRPGPISLEQALSARGVTVPPRVVQVMPFDKLCR